MGSLVPVRSRVNPILLAENLVNQVLGTTDELNSSVYRGPRCPLFSANGSHLTMRYRLLLTIFLLPGFQLLAFPRDEPKRIEAVNLACNTDGDEVDPHVTSDGKAIYYSLKSKGGKRFQFMVSRRPSTLANWGKGEEPDEPNLFSASDDRGLSLTPEGIYKQYVFFSTRKDDAPEASFDLFVGVKEGRDRIFSTIAPVRNVSEKEDEMHPWLTGDGRALYFSRKTSEGWRIFVARRAQALGTQGFDDVKMLKEFPPDFKAATLTPNGMTMFLQGPLENGKTGLYRSRYTSGAWGKPEPLEMLNHPEAEKGDMYPALTRDGMRLYFVSDRPGGKGGLDLWTVPVAPLLK